MWPIWLLDIDGVINADPKTPPLHVWPEDQWKIRMVEDSNGKQWKITAAHPVIDFIQRIHGDRRAEIRWLTTWQRDANQVSAAYGLPQFPVLSNPMAEGTRYHGSRNWWKYHEATKISVTGRPVIWTDDDLSREIQDDYRAVCRDTLLIAPKGSEGLGPWHLAKIAQFLGFEWRAPE